MADFDYDIVNAVAHRPWVRPDGPWLMTQSWHDLLFAHWRVSLDGLRPLIPDAFELELFEREAWIGIVPFHMTNVSPRGVPALPLVSEFPELNVRTYVRVGDKPGVYFFSLDAGSRAAVAAARALLNLPYHYASMNVITEGGVVHYESRRRDGTASAELVARYRPTGSIFDARPGSLEYFLTERYCLYALGHSGHPYRLEIHHPPWRLQRAEAEFSCNTMAEASSIRLPAIAPLLHFAKRQDIVAWAPQRIQ